MLAWRPARRQAVAVPDFSPCGPLWYIPHMDSRDALATLRHHASELRALGVVHAAVFGSVARGDHRPGSDLDIMIDVAPEARLTVYGAADGLWLCRLEGLHRGPVRRSGRCRDA